MTKLIWIVLFLFVVGNAFFVLPFHLSKETLTTGYSVNYKKDSDLLRAVFPDSMVHLQINLPAEYDRIYKEASITDYRTGKQSYIMVNVSVLNNLDFTSLSFPFYKVNHYNGTISFYSIIKVANIPDRDSTVLIGNIAINGKLSVLGICTPVYVRTLVERELVNIFKKEISKIEQDINRHPAEDTLLNGILPEASDQQHIKKKKR